MTSTPLTRPSLLIRLRNHHDHGAWCEFVEIYVPLIHGFAMRRGWQDSDAADLAQDVLSRVASTIERFDYEPKRGSFRSWLFTVTLNRMRRLATLAKRQPAGSGDSGIHASLAETAAVTEDEEEWNRQHQMRLFHWAAEQAKREVKSTTWEAFWQTAVQQKSPAQVALDLAISVGTVYVSKNRMIARIREKIEQVEPLICDGTNLRPTRQEFHD